MQVQTCFLHLELSSTEQCKFWLRPWRIPTHLCRWANKAHCTPPPLLRDILISVGQTTHLTTVIFDLLDSDFLSVVRELDTPSYFFLAPLPDLQGDYLPRSDRATKVAGGVVYRRGFFGADTGEGRRGLCKALWSLWSFWWNFSEQLWKTGEIIFNNWRNEDRSGKSCGERGGLLIRLERKLLVFWNI